MSEQEIAVEIAREREVAEGDGALEKRTGEEYDSLTSLPADELAIIKNEFSQPPAAQTSALEGRLETKSPIQKDTVRCESPALDRERFPYHELVRDAAWLMGNRKLTGQQRDIGEHIVNKPELFDVRDVRRCNGGYTFSVYDRTSSEVVDFIISGETLKRLRDTNQTIRLIEEAEMNEGLRELANRSLEKGDFDRLEGLVYLGFKPDEELAQRIYRELFDLDFSTSDQPRDAYSAIKGEFRERVHDAHDKITRMVRVRRSSGIEPKLSGEQERQIINKYTAILTAEERLFDAYDLFVLHDATGRKIKDSPELQNGFIRLAIKASREKLQKDDGDYYRKWEDIKKNLDRLEGISEGDITRDVQERTYKAISERNGDVYHSSRDVKSMQDATGWEVPESVLDELVWRGFTEYAGHRENRMQKELNEARRQFPQLEYKPELVEKACLYWADKGQPEHAQAIADFTKTKFTMSRDEVVERCRGYIATGNLKAVRDLCTLTRTELGREELRSDLVAYSERQRSETGGK